MTIERRTEGVAQHGELFDGTPTPQTQGDIFCPSQNAYYPDVKDCPNGWQRIIREADDVPDDGYAG